MTTPPNPVPLNKLLESAKLTPVDVQGNPACTITGLTTHAQTIRRNQMFVAIAGTKTDSHQLIGEAVERGAAAVLVERAIPAYPGVTVVRVSSSRAALGPLAHAFHGHPARAMSIVAVTGTNGKTTTTSIIRGIMHHAGRRTGLIGTLGAFWGKNHTDDSTTTPDALTLARTLYGMEKDGVNLVAMEASSHGIDQARIAGMPIHVGVLTNVTQDHLDYHGDYPTYISVKRRLFFDHVKTTPGGIACLNHDDHVGEELCESYDGDKLCYSSGDDARRDVHARNVQHGVGGLRFDLVVKGETVRVASRLIGSFNLSNMVAAATACHALGLDAKAIAAGLESVQPVSGRFETVDAGQPFLVVVDYAHTPDAIEKALRTARQLTAGKLITVFGCGGDRDRTKRPLMGKAAGRLSDVAIITSDNPRNEDPERIARGALEGVMQSGMKPAQYQTILDRANAIESAIHRAGSGDCVMILGKGHESYQEIHGKRFSFDDRQIAREILRGMSANWAPTSERNPNATEARAL